MNNNNNNNSSNNSNRPHSEEYFGEYRDHWWNSDYIELLAKRWNIQNVKTVLDVGCGVGHWGRVLLPVLPPNATIHGIDMEPLHIEKARSIAEQYSASHRLTYSVAQAQSLPFPNESFDMVTCQTVLIHVSDILATIQEMERVLKPGGLLVIAEPNNAANNLVEDSLSFDLPLPKKLARIELALTCENGKSALGEGNNSIGDLIPGLLVQAGISNIRVFLNDKTAPLFPPYNTPEQRANVEQMIEWNATGFLGFDKQVAKRYFLAGGGCNDRFEHLWENEHKIAFERSCAGIRNNTLHSAGGCVFYVISARKE